ncbi:hypothetical protein NEOLEDRAFT_1062201 [Neolentinus lepideus HHB14362 ss-1]|uniref:Uncharacterized protein n=1 Tax=Neolentinus lepideus HHB14362 ss-1 TaxID=1314782 RepID=A0A165TJC0_9AGAM|nr:hypothetical protein NEOLEDRAFT_1062201 [Neolentinus lepideus HHB14362 ss-1]
MSSTATVLLGSNPHGEREMTKNQRGLVDACFEEGQYESGISLLQQLRSSGYKPSPSHIRQLLYIALYPPPDKGKEKSRPDFGSPSKVPPAKQKKSALIPTAAASEAAIQCLTSYLTTNTPKSLLRALPSYPPPKGRDGVQTNDMMDEDEDSFISREAANITQCKDCWTILREGFILRADGDPSSDRSGAKARRKLILDEDTMYSDSTDTDVPVLVGEHAWPVLEWLIEVIEKDANLTGNSGHPRYSPLLLCQIPPARTGTIARWEADKPLDIMMYCLHQTEPSRRLAGARLASLLIDLTSVVHFDAAAFTNAVFARLIAEGGLMFSDFLAILPDSVVASKFRLALCRKFLATNSSVDSVRTVSASKPQGRIQPRARRRGAAQTGEDVSPKAVDAQAPETIASRLPLPSSSEILQLVQTSRNSTKHGAAVEESKVKFYMVLAYGKLQNGVPSEDRDADWPQILQDGTLRKALDDIMASRPGEADMKDLIISTLGA